RNAYAKTGASRAATGTCSRGGRRRSLLISARSAAGRERCCGVMPVPVAAALLATVMKAIETEAIFTRFATRVDGSLSATLCTPELAVSEKVALMELQNRN